MKLNNKESNDSFSLQRRSENMLYIGSHVGFNKNTQLLGSVDEGDFIEISGELVAFDYTQRKIEFEAKKVVTHCDNVNGICGEYLVKPQIICRAKALCEVAIQKERG